MLLQGEPSYVLYEGQNLDLADLWLQAK